MFLRHSSSTFFRVQLKFSLEYGRISYFSLKGRGNPV